MDLVAMPHLQSVAATDPNVPVGPEHVSTLSFTSGSTGVPKGCRGRAISLTHFYPWMAEEFGLSENDRFTMLSGIAHDPIQRDVFTPIFFGASIHVPSQQDIAEPGRLAQWCAENRVSVTVLTPAMGQLLSADASSAIPSLKSAFFVGDVLAKRDVIRLQQLAPNCTVVNMMGSTETQRSVSYFKIPSSAVLDHAKEIIPAGIGMRDVQLLVLNKNMQPCGIGEVGELFMRSHHMAKGYLSLPEDTAQKFLPNPFVPEAQRVPTDRLYRTGDVGRYLPSGLVECMGRRDDQVKIRGFRVELREIDTFLIQHPSVREAVTLLRRDIAEEHRLVAYFVPQTGTSFTVEELRAHLREKLPAYAIPSDFVPLSKMPLNPNGKIDKARLPFPDTVSSQLLKKQTDSGSGAAVELTPLQQLIHGCWKDILHRSEIGLNDSFFDLGGHSVSATMLVFQLRKRLQQSDLPLALLYDFPTIAQMSAAIARSGDATVVTDKQPVAAAATKLDLAAEVALDESIRPAPQGHTGEKLVFFLVSEQTVFFLSVSYNVVFRRARRAFWARGCCTICWCNLWVRESTVLFVATRRGWCRT
jgi:L-aminoadipate-semialdehyde dehydrogenase